MSLSVLLPVDTAETWAAHFTSRGWSTPQDQITAGFPIYAQPAAASGYYEETFDQGTVLDSSRVSVEFDGAVVSGTPTVACTLSLSPDGTTWTDYPGTTSVFGLGFRYVKVRITVTQSGGLGLWRLTALAIKLDAKLRNDGGNLAALAADATGTTVTFAVPFFKVVAITATPGGTALRTCVVDFTDTPNPTTFKVKVYDSTGTRVDATVYWQARGY